MEIERIYRVTWRNKSIDNASIVFQPEDFSFTFTVRGFSPDFIENSKRLNFLAIRLKRVLNETQQ